MFSSCYSRVIPVTLVPHSKAALTIARRMFPFNNPRRNLIYRGNLGCCGDSNDAIME